MKTYLCRHGLLLWLELKGRRVLPDHEDLDPYRLTPVLASRFVLDLSQAGLRSVETGTRVRARLPSFTQSPQSSFDPCDGAAFAEIARIVVEEGNGAVIVAQADDVQLEILLMPLTLHRIAGRRILGIVADCNPYAQPGPSEPLSIKSCRFLSKELHDFSSQRLELYGAENSALTSPDQSETISFASKRQKLIPKIQSRLLQ